MSYYTEIKLKFTLKKDTPEEIIKLIDRCVHHMDEIDDFYKNGGIRSVSNRPNMPIEHPFGKATRWQNFFIKQKFNSNNRRFIIDAGINYAWEDLNLFLDWIAPYIVQSRKIKGTYLGWSKGEDSTQIHWYLEYILSKNFKLINL